MTAAALKARHPVSSSGPAHWRPIVVTAELSLHILLHPRLTRSGTIRRRRGGPVGKAPQSRWRMKKGGLAYKGRRHVVQTWQRPGPGRLTCTDLPTRGRCGPRPATSVPRRTRKAARWRTSSSSISPTKCLSSRDRAPTSPTRPKVRSVVLRVQNEGGLFPHLDPIPRPPFASTATSANALTRLLNILSSVLR